jgi:hypothetical protein
VESDAQPEKPEQERPLVLLTGATGYIDEVPERISDSFLLPWHRLVGGPGDRSVGGARVHLGR